MTKIKKLTQSQIDRFPHYVKKWKGAGLSCEPLDIERATKAVGDAYVVAGLEPPKRIVIADSPLSGAIVATMLNFSGGDSVKNSVWDCVVNSAWDSLAASVQASVWNSVWSSMRDSVEDSVWGSVGKPVQNSVADFVRDSVAKSIRDSVWDSLEGSLFGSHDAHWVGFYDFFVKECGLEGCGKIYPLMELAKHCGWWIPYKDLCILQHRHSELHYNSRGQLHNGDGMAIKYRDGWGVYMWNGRRIPESNSWIITNPEKISVETIANEPNAKLRRIQMQRIERL